MRALALVWLGLPLLFNAALAQRDACPDTPYIGNECRAVRTYAAYLRLHDPEQAEGLDLRGQAGQGARLFLEHMRAQDEEPGRRYPTHWHEYLPCCPQRVERAQERPEWRDDLNVNLNPTESDYHPGANLCYRSRSGYPSGSGPLFEGLRHGQQCCYDDAGDLIDDGGPGSGTPDLADSVVPDAFWLRLARVAVSRGSDFAATIALWETLERPAHLALDVFPFHLLRWDEYRDFWKPNLGEQIVSNPPENPIWVAHATPESGRGGEMHVEPGDVVALSAWGRVHFVLSAGDQTVDVGATADGAPNLIEAVPEAPCPWLSLVAVVFSPEPPFDVVEQQCVGSEGEVTVQSAGQFGVFLNPATHTFDGDRIANDYGVNSPTQVYVSYRRVAR